MEPTSLNDLIQYLARTAPPDGHIWVAYSGGMDSTVALHAGVKAFGADRLSAIHINHNLSDLSLDWQKHCHVTAKSIGVEIVIRDVELAGGNVEVEGRRARLASFAELTKPEDTVITAHHADDLTESLFWQLATGRAMVGIEEWSHKVGYRLWRPLLNLRRQQLRHIAEEEKLDWVEDDSNKNLNLTRNFLRHDVLPRLKSRFPDFATHLRTQATRQLQKQSIGSLPLSEDSLTEEQIRQWLYNHDILPSAGQLAEIQRQFNHSVHQLRVHLSDGVVVWVESNSLQVSRLS